MTSAGRLAKRHRARAALLPLVFAGCASILQPPRAGLPPPPPAHRAAAAQYQKSYDRWTRHDEVYDTLDTRVFLAGTLQSMAFREARVAYVAAFSALPTADAQAMLDAERKAHQEALEVVLGFYVNEKRFDDLARPNSIWRVTLSGEAGEVLPIAIERIIRPDPNMTSLYPFLGPFWIAYRLRFPRAFPNGAQVVPEGSRSVTLRISSSVGKAKLTWEIDAPAAGGSLLP